VEYVILFTFKKRDEIYSNVKVAYELHSSGS
jgi:hypothetical protein